MIWKEVIQNIHLDEKINRLRLTVGGRVQGVGFRPGIFRLASAAGLGGSVKNTRRGVIIEIEGPEISINRFGRALMEDLPPRARIDTLRVETVTPLGEAGFSIEVSEEPGAAKALFPVDTAVCSDCLREMWDPRDARYRYPFINCTNCGPRFTIIEGLPYDRPLTTMSEFRMDGLCRKQYADPGDRRFHAEPISCPGCGPVLKLLDRQGREVAGDPLENSRRLLAEGNILAVKGLGGYHLACDAQKEEVVRRLRERKRRPAKPFALIFRDLHRIKEFCRVDDTEEELLASPEAPIVLLRRGNRSLPEAIAPHNAYLGAFLPYTPVHHLLLEDFPVLVMTSANFTDEPLISLEEELTGILGTIADGALVNNRRIAHKCDDSIFFVPAGLSVPLRRARGFVPEPVGFRGAGVCLLGTGGQEKGTFALTRDEQVFISPHLGDLDDFRSQRNYRAELAAFQKMLNVSPRVVVHDEHPDYFTSRLAAEIECDARISIQHHHAHAVSVMAEHSLRDPVVAVTFDGTGYGSDGKLWGGEFLLAQCHRFERLARLKYLPLPGGEAAVREPWRMALMHLRNLWGDDVLNQDLPGSLSFEGLPAAQVLDMAVRGINSLGTSSMGRLFDAVSYLLGGREKVSYEAEAAVALESLAREFPAGERSYPFDLVEG
ncbi:MAG: carbamoyltransferase HypF, partial [Candidatus Krumholzibacteriota bacterium]|nr:carbamoyltransferase HypF [Candidatus Krumholzibacteriota bacterium]